jgi:hypothetical protein
MWPAGYVGQLSEPSGQPILLVVGHDGCHFYFAHRVSFLSCADSTLYRRGDGGASRPPSSARRARTSRSNWVSKNVLPPSEIGGETGADLAGLAARPGRARNQPADLLIGSWQRASVAVATANAVNAVIQSGALFPLLCALCHTHRAPPWHRWHEWRAPKARDPLHYGD